MLKIIFTSCFFLTVLTAQNNWQTEFEKSKYLSTCSYDETINYFNQLAEKSEYAKMVPIGESPQGRILYAIIINKDKSFEPVDITIRKKPVVLIQNGIHSGEIEGKDASMLLLKEILITKEKEYLIENLTLLVIPVFNVDGHERKSPYNRINQNGPTEMGWRTTAQNLNLNRDYTKADAPEMKAFLRLYSNWLPDLYIDNHTTDGIDYQYTITYGIETHQNVDSEISNWISNEFIPTITKDVESDNYLIAPYVGIKDRDINKGIIDWVSGPRFSHGYAAAQNRVGLLIETHMLKPYKDRVFSTKSMLESALKIVNNDAEILLNINRQADISRIAKYHFNKEPFPIDFKTTENNVDFNWKGIEYEMKESKAAGTSIPYYNGKHFSKIIPYYNDVVIEKSLIVPDFYVVPKEYKQLIEIMNLHGIEYEVLPEKNMTLVKTVFSNIRFPKNSYEGRFRPSFDIETKTENVKVNKGDYLVTTNQREISLIVELMEPECDDSFIKWGMMNSIFERKEYFEMYLLDSLANKMLEENESLRNQFNEKLKDEDFANNPYMRLYFFYEHTPYFDEKLNVYPIMKSVN